MDPIRAPAPAPAPSEQDFPKPAQAAPPPYQARAPFEPTPPSYHTSDWHLTMPGYQKFLKAKVALGVASVVFSAVIIGLAKTFGDKVSALRDPMSPVFSDSFTFGAAELAIIWTAFEVMVMYVFNHRKGYRKGQRQGIHPGGHMMFHLTISIVSLFSLVQNVKFLQERGDPNVRYYKADTPPSELEELGRLHVALLTFITLLAASSLVLFSRACLETWQINSGRYNLQPIPLEPVSRRQQATHLEGREGGGV